MAFRRFLRETTPSLLAAACALFAVSLVADERWAGNHLLEDGSKFLGIVAWSTYFILASAAQLRDTRPARSGLSFPNGS